MQKIMLGGAMIIATTLYALDADARSRLSADLSGAEEIVDTTVATDVSLPVKGLVTGAYGDAKFTLSADRSTLSYTLNVSKTGSAVFMAHIHLGPPDRNGPVMLWLFGDPAHNPLPITLPRNDPAFANDGKGGGTVSGTLTATDLLAQPTLGVVDFADAVANILQGNAYVNVHTVDNRPGEIRGQIRHGVRPLGGLSN